MRQRQIITRALLCAALLAVGAPAEQAHAQDGEDQEIARQVEELSKQAASRYKARDYEGAIELFKKAYDLEPVPNLLYNIARCYEKLEEHEKAIEYYERFIVAPDIDSGAREKALSRAQQQREILAAKDKLDDAPKDNGGGGQQANNGGGENGGGETGPPDNNGGGGEDTGPGALAYVTLGAGVAFLGGGAVMGVMARGKQQEFESATTPEDKIAARDAGQTRALIADGLYVAGGIATVVGVVLVLRGGGDEDAAPQAASRERGGKKAVLSPWFAPGAGGLQLMGRF